MIGVPPAEPAHIESLVARYRQAFSAQVRSAIQESIDPTPLRAYLIRLVEAGMLRDVETVGIGWLPILACEACGADGARALPVAAAWQLVRLAVKLLDDVEDGDGGASEHSGIAINAATALLSVAHVTIGHGTGMSLSRTQRTADGLQHALLLAASGQHRDLAARGSADPMSPDEWLAVAEAKSGALLRWAVEAGALVAGARRALATALGEYGWRLGILLQLADDLTDCWRGGDDSDLAAGSLTLPLCYALWVASDDEQRRLAQLLLARRQGDQAAASQLGQMLIDMGAQAYLLTVALAQRAQALAALDRAAPALGETGRLLLEPMIDYAFPAFRPLGV